MSDRERDGPGGLSIPGLFKELHKRRVIRTALYYAGISAAIVEGADAFAEPLGLPPAAVRFLAILAVAASPLVLILSWLYDVSDEPPHRAGVPGKLARGLSVLTAALLSAAILAALWRAPITPPGAAARGTAPMTRVAVLAFEAPGGTQAMRTLAEHLHGRLIDGLSAAIRAPDVVDPQRYTVISRAGVLPFSRGDVTVDSIGRALGVGTIVEGVLEALDDSVRIRLRLIDAESADQLDSRVASAPVANPVALADELAEEAVSMLREQLGEVVQRRTQLLGTRSSEAFRHVLWAEDGLSEFHDHLARDDLVRAEQSLDRVDSLYRQASRLDPEWVEPVVLRGFLSDTRAQLASARGEASLEPIYRRGLDIAAQAIAITPGDRRALHLRGSMRLQLAGTTPDPEEAARLREGAEADLRASVLGNPRPAVPLRMLSELLASEGRYAEALEFGNRAYAEDRYLEGIDATLLRLFQYSMRLDRDLEALRHCTEGRRRSAAAAFEDCRLMLMAWSDVVDPAPDSAWAITERALAAYPTALRPRLEPRLQAMTASVLAEAGLADSARAVLSLARESDPDSYGVAVAAAGTLARLGDMDGALAQVRHAMAVVPLGLDAVATAPELRPLREAPRFQALLDSIRADDPG